MHTHLCIAAREYYLQLTKLYQNEAAYQTSRYSVRKQEGRLYHFEILPRVMQLVAPLACTSLYRCATIKWLIVDVWCVLVCLSH